MDGPTTMASNSSGSTLNGSLAERHRAWRLPALITLGLVTTVFLLFWQTSVSVVAIWIRSATFTHGFLILPISAWLIWQRRNKLMAVSPAPNWFGIPLLMVIGLGWLVARIAGVLVVEQLAMMAFVPTVVWTVLGWRATRLILFPLAFLFFAIPMGEELIPPLMDFTAKFTVSALRLTGVPVYQEGTFFEVPSGRWSVVEGCSGLRYLIASITLGCLYAYLTFRSMPRRLLFTALSAVVPVIANGLRAYMIVMIADLSNMRLARGIDHYIYGWVFFGLVMLLLFWIGTFWREDQPPPANEEMEAAPSTAAAKSDTKTMITVGGLVLAVIAVWPVLGALQGSDDRPIAASLTSPIARGGWQPVTEPISNWRPHYVNSDAALDQTYRKGDRNVSLYLVYYRRQRQGAELINSENYLVKQKDPMWRQTADSSHQVEFGGRRVEVRLAKMRSDNLDLLVWYWYWVDGRTTTNHYLAKLWDTRARLLGGKGDAAAIIVSTPITELDADADRTLQEFMTAMAPAVDASLEQAAHE